MLGRWPTSSPAVAPGCRSGRPSMTRGTPFGKMFFNILAAFAEFEVDIIRLRTIEGMAGPASVAS
jgi:DNA invertase Pin-like site-specific DNA recombinase